MIHTTSISCPVCGAGQKIEIEVSSLLRGAHFACPACGSKVGIQPECVETAQKVIHEFEGMKNKAKGLQ
jgi:predicted RNA-binding Zn-ribbon protein involved in translation (DUF1610 family)